MMMREEPKAARPNEHKPDKRSNIVGAALRAVTTILGIVLVLMPLALWVAWSERVLFLVVAIGIAAMAGLLLCHLLTDDEGDAAPRGSERSPRIGPVTVSDEFLAELSGMGPWTYHNRLTGHARFRMKMQRLRKLLKPD